MTLKLITPPSIEPITLTEAKLHIRVDGNDEDNLINSLIKVAREYSEDFQSRTYLTQTWELILDKFPIFKIEIPRPPLKEVLEIEYIDKDGIKFIIDPLDYIVDVNSEPGRIIPRFGKSWPRDILQPINGVKITFIAGNDNVNLVPEKVKQAMKLLIGHWYENREEINIGGSPNELSCAAKALLWQDRMVNI